MRPIRLVVLALSFPLCALPARAADDADDWKMIGGMLALVQQIVHLAATSPDGDAAQKSVDSIVAGENAQANRLAAGMLEEAMQDVPAEQRGVFVAIGRDLLTLARRERERAPQSAGPQIDPIQARKDLQAMGLKYWDEQQFLDAARRGDRIAVDLFVAAKGLEARSPQPAR